MVIVRHISSSNSVIRVDGRHLLLMVAAAPGNSRAGVQQELGPPRTP